MNAETDKVERALRAWTESKPMSLEVIMAFAGTNYNTTRGACIRLVKRGIAQRVGKGLYLLARTASEA